MIANENSPSSVIFQMGNDFRCNCFTKLLQAGQGVERRTHSHRLVGIKF